MSRVNEDIAYLTDLHEADPVPPGAVSRNIAIFGEDGKLADSGENLDSYYKSEQVDQIANDLSLVSTEIAMQVRNVDAINAYASDNWASNKAYAVGDFCRYGNPVKGYKCTSSHTSSAEFSPSMWELVLSDKGKTAIDSLLSECGTDKASLLSLADEYTDKEYNKDDLVILDGKLQVATRDAYGRGAQFSTNITIDKSIKTRIAAHADNTAIHVTQEEKNEWNGKQNAIDDLSQIRENAAEGADAAKRDYVEMSGGSVAAVASESEISAIEVDSSFGNSDNVSGNGFQLNLKSYVSKAVDGLLVRQVHFDAVQVYLRGSSEQAQMAICKAGEEEVLALSAAMSLSDAVEGALNSFQFADDVWLDPHADYEFKILRSGSQEYVDSLTIFLANDFEVDGFKVGQYGSYSSYSGCFRGNAGIHIRASEKIALAKKTDIHEQVQANWEETDATSPSYIENKPAIPEQVDIDDTLSNAGEAADAKAVGDALKEKLDTTVVDNAFDTATTGYAVGDTCIHDGKWYKCVQIVAVGDEWDANDWEETTVKDAIDAIPKPVNADWEETDATSPSYIENKPTIPEQVDIDDTLSNAGEAADAKAVGDALKEKLDSASIDKGFDTTSTGYAVGDTCIHDGKWYKCVRVVYVGDVWDAADWDEFTVKSAIDAIPKPVNADWDETDAASPSYIENKPAIPEQVDIDDTLSNAGEAADAKAVGDALEELRQIVPYDIVNATQGVESGNVIPFTLFDKAVNVISPSYIIPAGKTFRMVPPAAPEPPSEGVVVARDFLVAVYGNSQEEVTITGPTISMVDAAGGNLTNLSAAVGKWTIYRFTEISRTNATFMVSGAADPAWIAIKEIDRALDALLADGGLVDFEPGLYIEDSTGLFHKLTAVKDPETGGYDISVDDEGVER